MKLRRSAAWLAALAMALQALWPLIAQARPRSVTLVPICTVEGVTHYYELKGGETPLEQRSAAQHEHCSFCFFGAERFAALPAALPVAACEATRFLPADARVEAPRRFPQLKGSRPRAPPASS
ncbi:MAG TPA: DUF2946 family protein [Burkholderiales bacterium]|nr:DUF2946 family protein [Burkholderiales bacterium]